VRCVDLRCERLVDPIGIGTATPRLTWRIDAGDETDVVQLGHELEVAGGWSTGPLDGWRQQVVYAGPTLPSRAEVRWRVRATTTAGDTGWSDWAAFETGILDPGEWAATMVTASPSTPVVRFARMVDVPSDIVRARLRLTAHGIVRASIGGVDVTDDVLLPGWTSYSKRLPVRTYDVTALVAGDGPVELAALVGPGWFSGRLGWEGKRGFYGDHLGLFAQLDLERADGGVVTVGTDATWTATSTAYRLAELYDGETFDARVVDDEPATVSVVDGFDVTVLFAPPVPAVRRVDRLAPVTRTGTVIDFGQNLVGWLRMTVHDVPAGTEIVLRHAEVLDGDGRLFTAPLRTAAATDTYIAGGGAAETYEPSFTFHGFRYAEITGVDPERVDVEAVVVSSDVERIGTFSCADPLVERLHENVVWGQRGNFVSIPTDCPQRDERLGWTGDAQVFSPAASFLHDCETFWECWLDDLAADQAPTGAVPHVVPAMPMGSGIGAAGWGDAAVVVPWTTYVAYGDDAVLRRALPSMRAWVDFVRSRLDDEHRWVQDFQFGDWLDPDAPTEQPWKAKARYDLVATAYAAHVATLLARAASIVGDDDLAASAAAHADTVRRSWWASYGDDAARTQAGAALAIAFGLAPDDEARQTLGDALALRVHEADDHLATGFLGTPVLLSSLADTGHLDVAYDVLLQRTPPSWLYTVLAGATTIWERWDALRADGSVPLESLNGGSSMVSFNHYAYGAVADWLHATVAGLRPDPEDPGYHHVLVEPQPGGGLTRASAALATRYGRAAVAWHLDGDALHVDVEIPPNAWATVTLPGRAPERIGSGRRSFTS
jgi:alpha-L-rhamnosidase